MKYYEVKESFGGSITEIEVIKETDKFIEIAGLKGRWAKENSYSAFFPTKEQCKSWLIDRVSKDIKKYEDLHREAMERRSKYLQL